MIYLESGSKIKTQLGTNAEWYIGGLILEMKKVKTFAEYEALILKAMNELKMSLVNITYIINSINNDDGDECYQYVIVGNELVREHTVEKNPDYMRNYFVTQFRLMTPISVLYDHYTLNGGNKTVKQFSQSLLKLEGVKKIRFTLNGEQVRGYEGVGVKL